jgi:hypothetical protein
MEMLMSIVATVEAVVVTTTPPMPPTKIDLSAASKNPVKHESVASSTYFAALTFDAANNDPADDNGKQQPLMEIPESDVDCRDDADTRTSPTERPASAIAASPAEMDEPDSTKTTVDVDELIKNSIPTPDDAVSTEPRKETSTTPAAVAVKVPVLTATPLTPVSTEEATHTVTFGSGDERLTSKTLPPPHCMAACKTVRTTVVGADVEAPLRHVAITHPTPLKVEPSTVTFSHPVTCCRFRSCTQ